MSGWWRPAGAQRRAHRAEVGPVQVGCVSRELPAAPRSAERQPGLVRGPRRALRPHPPLALRPCPPPRLPVRACSRARRSVARPCLDNANSARREPAVRRCRKHKLAERAAAPQRALPTGSRAERERQVEFVLVEIAARNLRVGRGPVNDRLVAGMAPRSAYHCSGSARVGLERRAAWPARYQSDLERTKATARWFADLRRSCRKGARQADRA